MTAPRHHFGNVEPRKLRCLIVLAARSARADAKGDPQGTSARTTAMIDRMCGPQACGAYWRAYDDEYVRLTGKRGGIRQQAVRQEE